MKTMTLKEMLRPGYTEENGVYRFIETPSDMVPVFEKKKTFLGKKNEAFYREAFAALPAGAAIADMGAGPSYFTELLARFDVIPVDLFPYPSVRVVCDFSKELPFKDGVLDAILLSNTLEHLPEPAVLLAECRRILKPGGMLVGAVPFALPLHQTPYDFYRYTRYGLAHLFAAFGQVHIEPVASALELWKMRTERFFNAAARQGLVVRGVWYLLRRALPLIVRRTRHLEDPEDPIGYHFACVK